MNRRQVLAGVMSSVGLQAASAQDAARQPAATNQATGISGFGSPLLFVQQDQVLSFPATGDGVRVGTARGLLNGTTIQNFQFLPVPPPVFQADDRMALTDTDGDQILFRAQVTGRFLAPFGDPATPSAPVFGLGGPFTGTYTVINATGKYVALMGRKFPCKGLGSNPAKGNFFGTVYVEVYSDRFDGGAL